MQPNSQPVTASETEPTQETPDVTTDTTADVASDQRALQVSRPNTPAPYMPLHPSGLWQPPTDVFELEDRLVVLVEVAGIRDARLDIRLIGRRLVISGIRERSTREGITFHQVEVRYGHFHTEANLPYHVERERITAVYRDGFLRVELPRSESKQISVMDLDNS